MAKFKSKIKKGDTVIVIAGKSKDAKGTVLQVKKVVKRRKEVLRVLVEGVNMVKKAVRPNPNVGEKGGIQEKEAFLDISNVKLFNSLENKGERVGYRVLENNKKVRYFKKSGELVEAD